MFPKNYLLLLLLLCTSLVLAQQDYQIEGTTYSLKTEVDGPLTLLWNTIDGEYRYFAKKGNSITELVNTRVDGEYQEEYKQVLADLTTDGVVAVTDVRLTLSDLREFVNTYNAQKDPGFVAEKTEGEVVLRLGGFAGLMNNIYFVNPDNTSLFQAGVDFEITETSKLRRHSLLVQLRQVFSNSDYDFKSTQFSLNYRFKFVQSQAVDLFVNAKVAAYTYIDRSLPDIDQSEGTIAGSGGEFQSPLAFGLGADIPAGPGFISVAYNDIFAITLDNNGEFPVDFTVGYKVRL
jgi:hypothetical protein